MFCSIWKKPRSSLLFLRTFLNLADFSEVNVFEEKDISPEQERASELEYEGILKLTRQVLNTSDIESFHSRDFKFAINYWTSVRGHSQLLKRFHGGVPQYALDLFRILLKSGDASFVREAIKDEVNDMGGIFFLLEHLHLAYFKPHNQQLGLSKKIINVNDTEKLLEALEIVSLLLKSLIGKTRKKNDNVDYDIALLYLWYKRAWFLNEFASTTSLTATQIENAFDGAITVESCLANMSPIGENLITINTIDKEQLHNIYTILIKSWAQSSETTALGKALGYLNTMENDSRLGNHIANQIPYNSILNLCAQKKDDTTALEIWDRILAPESRVVPNSVTLGTLLLTLVTANQLNKAVTILNKSERGSKGLLLTNTTCYNIVLDGLAKTGSQGADKDAILFLQTMNELSETGANPNVSPDRVTYGIVLSILSKRGIPAEQIENILLDCHSRSINNKGIEPDWIMYNVVLNAYATQSSKNKDAAKRAESLLRIMEKNLKIHPETVCYNSVLHAYAASKDHSLEKIFALFEEMKVKSKAGNKRVSPDAFTLNTILNALVKDATEESIERARIFFQEFQELGVETDIVSFNTILKSMVKYGKMKGAESLLRKVEYDYNSGLSEIKPDGLSYNILLDGYAKIATRDAFKNAQKTMKKMETLALSNSDRADCMPDIISYTSVIDSYARTEFVDEGAGYVAEKILNDMIEAGISPNLICYNSVINCWAKSNHPDAPFKAEALLNRMQEEYNNDNDLVKPNLRTFTTVMNCWAKSKLDIAPDRAYKILQHLEHITNSGEKNMQPNAYSYATMISTWGKSLRSDAPDKAIEILDRVEENYKTGNSTVLANSFMYNAAIDAIARSKGRNKASEAASLLKRMINEFQGGNPEVAPSSISYSTVINACGYTKNPEEKKIAFQIARKIFRELVTEYQPDPFSYVNFITACANLKLPCSKRDNLIVSIIEDGVQRGQINTRVLQTFKRAVPNHIFQNTVDKYNLR